MALHDGQRGKMAAPITAIRSGFQMPANARSLTEDEMQSPNSKPIHPVGLVAITPLTWLDVRV